MLLLEKKKKKKNKVQTKLQPRYNISSSFVSNSLQGGGNTAAPSLFFDPSQNTTTSQQVLLRVVVVFLLLVSSFYHHHQQQQQHHQHRLNIEKRKSTWHNMTHLLVTSVSREETYTITNPKVSELSRWRNPPVGMSFTRDPRIPINPPTLKPLGPSAGSPRSTSPRKPHLRLRGHHLVRGQNLKLGIGHCISKVMHQKHSFQDKDFSCLS